MATRFAAWLVTGPPGHLYAGLADLTGLLMRLARDRSTRGGTRRRSPR